MIVDSPSTLKFPEVPAGAVLAGAAARWSERVALHTDGQDHSYAALYRRACGFAHALRAEGIGVGDRVAVHLPNCLEFAVAYHGILLSGATFTPANPLLPPADLAAQLADSGAVLAVSGGPAARALASVRERTSVRRVVLAGGESQVPEAADERVFTGFTRFTADQPTTRPDIEIDIYRDLAHLAYTGGTTGSSKGVRLSHRNVVVNALQFSCWRAGTVPQVDSLGGLCTERTDTAEQFPVAPGTSVSINLTPWFHAMGTIGSLNVAVLDGTTQVLHARFDPDRYLADAERFRVTGMAGAPPLFAALAAHPEFSRRDLSSVRVITSGAAPLAVELIRQLRERFGGGVVIGEGYGLTEVTMGACSGPAARGAVRKVGTVGLPVANTRIKLVAEHSDEPLPPGEAGEVCVHGPQVMAGYLDRPEETEAVLARGWLRTGDIGVLDEQGYLSIVDRKKDMLIYKGYNVYPRQLEELLLGQPGVRGAAVVGRLDPAAGELPVAFVVGNDLDPERLRTTVNDQLLPYQRIRQIFRIDTLPVSAAGKVLKRQLRERLR